MKLRSLQVLGVALLAGFTLSANKCKDATAVTIDYTAAEGIITLDPSPAGNVELFRDITRVDIDSIKRANNLQSATLSSAKIKTITFTSIDGSTNFNAFQEVSGSILVNGEETLIAEQNNVPQNAFSVIANPTDAELASVFNNNQEFTTIGRGVLSDEITQTMQIRINTTYELVINP